MSRFAERGLLGLIVLLSLALNLATLDDKHSWGDDWAQYVAQARGIAEGDVAREVTASRFRNEHSSRPFGPTVAMWGFPLLIAPVYAIAGLDLFALKLPGILLFLLFLVTLQALFRNSLGAASCLLLVALFAFNPYLIQFNNQILTDVPFLFYSSFSLLLIDRFIVKRKFWLSEAFSFALLGVVLFLASWTRIVGVLLVFTSLLCHVIEWRVTGPSEFGAYARSRRAALLAYLVPLLLALLAGRLLPAVDLPVSGQFAYLSDDGLVEALRTRFERLTLFLTLPGRFYYSSITPGWLETTLSCVSAPFVLLGLRRRYARDYALISYVVLYTGLLFAIKGYNGFRYLFPVLPVYIYFAFVGLGQFFASKDARPGLATTVFAGIVLGLFAAHFALRLTAPPATAASGGPFSSEGRAMLEYVEKNTRRDQVIAFFKPRALSLLTGRRSIMVSLEEQLRDGRCDFAVVFRRPVKNQIPLTTRPERAIYKRFPVVYESRMFFILDVRGG
jgi:hypothetical protein